MADHHQHDLFRMTTRAEWSLRAEPDDDGRIGTLIGYAARFGEETIINGWEGHFREVLMPGAFAKTLNERGERVKVLFNHGFDPSVGDKPLGKPAVMREDANGLWVEVPLDDTSYNRDLAASLRSGALDGMSFRFNVVREEWSDLDTDGELPLRALIEVRLLELGPVTFPAYEATTAGVRGREAYTDYLKARTADAGPTPTSATSYADEATTATGPLGTMATDDQGTPPERAPASDYDIDAWLVRHREPPAIVTTT